MKYPVDLTPDDNDTILAVIPDVPGVVSFGETEDEALDNVEDALEAVLSAYISDRKDIPAPSPAAGRPVVGFSLLGTLKLAVYQAMRDRSWRKADLARALGQNPSQTDRLLDLTHASTVAQLEAALAACGRSVEVTMRDLAA